MIKLHSLRCQYDKKLILDNITLEIDNHLCILGANGSGKSTLAKAICSLEKCDGKIFIDEVNIDDFSTLQRAKLLSYIPAKLDIYDSFISVEEFVLLGRFPYKTNYFDYSQKDRKITTQTLEFLNISHLKNHSVLSLSSGEQQLCLIAQALSQQSKIIIFDEPTANLDPQNSKIIAQHIKGLKEYHQIILITHDLHLASYVDSPVLFIKDKTAHYHKYGIFSDSTLQELYGVEFENMVLRYE